MNIFKIELKRGFKSLGIWSLVCTLLIILFMSMFPSMKDSGMQELVNTKMDALPEAMLEAFNIKDMPDFTKLNQYFAYVFQYIVMAGCVYAGILGSKSLISEESEGTIEFLYAKPASRNRIVSMKLLANLILFYIFTFIMAIVSILISLAVKPEDLKILDLLTDIKLLYSGSFLIGLVFMSLGFLTSVLVPHLRLAMPTAIGIFFTTYLLGVFSGMIDALEFLKYLSPFHYAVPSEIIKSGFKTINILLSFIIIFFSILFTYVVYKNKDFKI